MKYVFIIVLVVAVITAAWRILEPEVTNAIFQDEIRDVAAGLGARTGRLPPTSDLELRDAVLRDAARHEIDLDASQVKVEIGGTVENRIASIEVNYDVPVDLVVYKFVLHFHTAPEVKQGHLPR